jgi:hypothetical protein
MQMRQASALLLPDLEMPVTPAPAVGRVLCRFPLTITAVSFAVVRMPADGVVPAEALLVFDDSIRVTSAKLRALEELEAFAEKQMAIGPGLDMEHR